MNRLWVRLSLVFLLVAWIAVGAVALIVRSSIESSFRHYVNQRDNASFDSAVVDRLEAYFAENGTWTGAEALLPGPRPGQGQGQGQGRGAGGAAGSGGRQVMVADMAGVVQAATDPALVGTALDASVLADATALYVDGEQAGWLAQQTPGAQALGEAEQRFLDDTTDRLAITAIVATLVAVLAGALLAWQLTRPLRALTAAAHDLAAGALGRQVSAGGTAETTDLARAFNAMSRDLAEGEALRQRMATDMAHELRTPVSVLRGHLEAMLDGVFPLDGEHLAVAYDRTIHLSRLVDDLRLLTRAEAGTLSLERVAVPADELARRAVQSFEPLALDANITLEHDFDPGLPAVRADIDRMQQVFGNLLTNALRHTPPEGRITVRAARQGNTVRFAVSNTGQALSPEQAAQVFKPFWRAEDARARDTGGSGLGLAIAQQLVALHGGRIWVESTPGLTTFLFELPV